MKSLTRRELLKTGAYGAAAAAISPLTGWKTVVPRRQADALVFRPYPHVLTPEVEWAYATDVNGDPFEAPITITSDGIVVPESVAEQPFAVNARWFVEGFGNVWLDADNQGQMWTREDFVRGEPFILNVAFAETRVARNAEIMARYRGTGTNFSPEVTHLHAMAADLLTEARQEQGALAARTADQALMYALWAGEKIELEHARQQIARMNRQDQFFFGCETRQYIWAKSVAMVDRFVNLFNYATVTHYVYDTWYPVFEPTRGDHRFGIKDEIVDWLLDHGITPEGRPLFWFHSWVMDDWLKNMSYSQLKDYVVQHTEEVVGHYQGRIDYWEVVNEYHDWANVHGHTPDQITQIVRQACEKVHEVNPNISRLINNCCPYGTYAASGRAAHGVMDRPLRTPRKFVQDIVEAEVPFETLGVQMYFPERDLSEIVRQVERFAVFGKPIYITEIGTSSGPTEEDLLLDRAEMPGPLYDWHRPWDQELQADWLEQTYTVFYSKPYIHNVSWYDFTDFRAFITNGGIVTEDTTPKLAYERLKSLLEEWDRLPDVEVDAPETPTLIR